MAKPPLETILFPQDSVLCPHCGQFYADWRWNDKETRSVLVKHDCPSLRGRIMKSVIEQASEYIRKFREKNTKGTK
jgi:hypothetical protein